jgi:hypothetical protein
VTEWWEAPYKGGPMAIPAAYYPRPLYPPDAQGKTPSGDGPDALAYKRTLSRLGRWAPWEPSKWDDSYSNNFAHGRGPNVGDSGIAGFQRQMNISPDTGWIGKTTFNALASARVPQGPHAGEMGMDANAANLIMEAFSIYGGKAEPPSAAPTETTRQRALDAACSWLGYVESGNNDTVFGAWYGMNFQPWCSMFICYVHEVQAGGSPSWVRGQNYSYVPYVVNHAKAKQNGLSTTTQPIPGDLCCFDWQHDGVPDHIGLWESGTPSSFNCIEGNTSPSDNSNGGQVMRRQRSGSGVTFVRVAEP